jgi:hypothetical protein
MWKFCILVSVFMLATSSLFAQSETLTESMTEEQLAEFNRNRLSVDVSIVAVGLVSGIAVESHRRWEGRQGFEQLSESQFYAIAGYPEQAEKAGIYKQGGWALLIGGGAMCVGGLAWMTFGITSLEYDDPDYSTKMNTSLYGGMVLSLVGLLPLFIGERRVRTNWSSVQQARMVADEYNRKLAEKILSRGKSRNDQTASKSIDVSLNCDFKNPE